MAPSASCSKATSTSKENGGSGVLQALAFNGDAQEASPPHHSKHIATTALACI
jgi:hypothetical protein